MINVNFINQSAKLGIYVHIPFCVSICSYCDFIKTNKFDKTFIENYFLQCEIQLSYFLNLFNSQPVTLYFGGGTPSIFSAKYYKNIIDIVRKFSQNNICECTLECNPFLINNTDKFYEYKEIGINRVTLGVQSLSNNVLNILERKHTQKQILKSIKILKQINFEQIQIDIIYGINIKREISLQDELNILMSLGITGISSYLLTKEKNTKINTNFLTDEFNAVKEYFLIYDNCLFAGMKNIEISNFSFYEAKHNNIYWYGYPYIGIGIGAHGLLNDDNYGLRYSVNNKNIESNNGNYIFDNNFMVNYEKRSFTDYVIEMFYTLLRTPKGIPKIWLINNFGQQALDNFYKNNKINYAIKHKHIIDSHLYIYLSVNEKFKSDAWVLDFINCFLS